MSKKNQNNKRPSPHLLIGFALLFVTSAGLRVSTGTLMAATSEPAIGDMAESMPILSNGENCYDETVSRELLQNLLEREKKLIESEALVEESWAAIDIAKAEIADNLAALENAEMKLQETIALSQDASENDLGQLTSVYEAMKPKDAANLFQTMSPEFAAGFLARMKADSAASIMAGLPAETAYSISVILAGRNAAAPTQ